MGYVLQRGSRYTGYYRRNGRRVSVGTFDTKREAFKAALLAEDGEAPEPVNMRLDDYIASWVPDCLPITRKGYEAVLKKHVLPKIGGLKVSEVTRGRVRKLLADLRSEEVGNATIRQCKAALGAAFRPLVESEQIAVNPTHGIRLKSSPSSIGRVLEQSDYRRISAELNDHQQVFVRVLIEVGLRYGEATALRVEDIVDREIYVRRRVSEIGKQRNNGQRFLFVDGTKSGHSRVVTISEALSNTLREYIAKNSLSSDALLFSQALILGRGTMDAPLPRDAWRKIWKEAIAKSGIGYEPRTHDLRHANATALLKSGVDVHEVKERLGHQSIRTTERYLHRVRSQQSKAAEAVGGYLE